MNRAPREVLLDAVVRLVASDGLDGATVRRVAREAAVSIGMVQHHFPTKDAMVLAAMESVSSSVVGRARAASDGPGDPGETLRSLAGELVPLDNVRGGEGRVWLAFVARAAVVPELRAVHARYWQELEDVLTRLLAAHRHGEDTGATVPADRDGSGPERADARLLLAVLDGLAVGGLVESQRLSPGNIRRVLDPFLDVLLTPERRSGGH